MTAATAGPAERGGRRVTVSLKLARLRQQLRAVEWQEYPLPVGRYGVPVMVRRLCRDPAAAPRAVVLMPGANSSCDTFLLPPGGGLADHLVDRGWDVFLLDWRPSPLVVNKVLTGLPLGGSAEIERLAFTLDRAVEEDIPDALALVRQKTGYRPISVLGHCVGGGGLAMAVARGLVAPFGVDRVVFSTLALFYEVPWNTWIKAEDFLLERMFQPGEMPDCRRIDPHDTSDWPECYRQAFDRWPRQWLPQGTDAHALLLQQLSFMVGVPYSRDKLIPGIDELVPDVFGPLHAGLYVHLGQMVRRGYAAGYNVQDVVDRVRLPEGLPARRAPRGDFCRRRFRDLGVTLVAAGDDGVWHRDSLDLMYEWLRREPSMRCALNVLPGYNIQELFWGRQARAATYDIFVEGLGGSQATA
jgi:hypothetical protein